MKKKALGNNENLRTLRCACPYVGGGEDYKLPRRIETVSNFELQVLCWGSLPSHRRLLAESFGVSVCVTLKAIYALQKSTTQNHLMFEHVQQRLVVGTVDRDSFFQ